MIMATINKLFPMTFALLLSGFCLGSGENLSPDPIDLESLRQNRDDWEILDETILEKEGSLKLYQDKWLMYFVHWRPLTEDKKEVSLDYVRSLLLSFWGPDMPFEVSDKTGQMSICGHEALWAECTIYDGGVRTRFIVWNCPETKRQFVADCNINTRRGTSPDLLDLQQEISSTICCHGKKESKPSPPLTQEYKSERFNLSFFIPENWRTTEFNDPKWFPEGVTETNGSLWTLLTDSEKYVELRWLNEEKTVSEDLLEEFWQKAQTDSLVWGKAKAWISDIQIDHIEKGDDYIWAKGDLEYNVKMQDKERSRPFVFKAFLWNNQKTYFLLASMACLQEFWNMPNDLSPTPETFDKFVYGEILKNVKVFNKSTSDKPEN